MPPIAKTYFDAIPTINAARKAGMAVGDYVEKFLSKNESADSQEGGVGATKRITDQLLSSIVLAPAANYLEIGPGTGRYVTELLRRCPGTTGELYESDPGWAMWLAHLFRDTRIAVRKADGQSLSSTGSETIDLCTAHGVFVYLDTMITFSYLKEMARCSKAGGYIFFDILDSDRQDMLAVIERTMVNCNYLIPLAGRLVVEFMDSLGVEPVRYFKPADSAEIASYLLFRKKAAIASSGSAS